MRITQITKDLVGKTIYGYPTGNNARRGVDQQEVVPFVVQSVARKYARLSRKGFYRTERVDINTGDCADQLNAGYIWLETPEDAVEMVAMRRMRRELTALQSGRLTDDQVRRIHAIVTETPDELA